MITRAQSLGLAGLLVYLVQWRNGHLPPKRYGRPRIFDAPSLGGTLP